ncbi:hypothetical protein DSM3645_21739 [Blastopirellula marina DSM 3645]|uniref:Uncharacterized protein n=2 Tax=Blastopirellula marina TaxID=124 RepID=A3ZUA3_9BACT|nr:hypothetical protein DSM3645_21739 [Blastopirellula marina DSM 3645]
MSQNLVTPPTYQRQSTAFESEMVDQVEEEEGVLDVEEEMTSTPNFETLVELYAQCVLQLDEMETEQFVSDFEDVAVQLGLAPGDVGLRVGVKILLCLSLERMLGLSGAGAL